MTRLVTLLGYGLIALAAIVVEVVARREGRFATFSQALTVAFRFPLVRWLLLAVWLWLGWHLFVRVEWR